MTVEIVDWRNERWVWRDVVPDASSLSPCGSVSFVHREVKNAIGIATFLLLQKVKMVVEYRSRCRIRTFASGPLVSGV